MESGTSFPKIGVGAWSCVGFVAATVIVVTALGLQWRSCAADLRGQSSPWCSSPWSESWYGATGCEPSWPPGWSSWV